jgi:hypothetical protein
VLPPIPRRIATRSSVPIPFVERAALPRRSKNRAAKADFAAPLVGQRQKTFGKSPCADALAHEEAEDYLATARIGQPLLFASIAQQHGLSKGPARAQDGGEAQRHQQHAKPGCHPAPPVVGRLGDGRRDRRG